MLCFVLCELFVCRWCDLVFCWLCNKLPLWDNKDDLDLALSDSLCPPSLPPQSYLGCTGLLLATAHALVYGWSKWADPRQYVWCMPPSFTLACLLPLSVLLGKAALQAPCLGRRLELIRRGWERPALPAGGGETGLALKEKPLLTKL